ncbi:MAG: adenosine deaminase [Actinomycetota bacterium]|nr:adenosine deaminase [Actinomycetota bacterium]
MAVLEQLVRTIPKAELHLHIEGTLEPELMFELARRNRVSLPFPDVAAVRAAYQFTDLQSFLDIYYQATAVLQTERDFYHLMAAYLRRAYEDGVRRAEIFFDPQAHIERGIGFEVFMPGFGRAIDEARDLGISVGLIMCFLRHLPGEAAVETLHQAQPFLDQILGVGLDSSEVGNPPAKFAQVFTEARAEGLRAVAHAGEEGPPSYIVQALEVLEVERIDHGVRCEGYPGLVERLVDEQIPLTVCPLSNVKLRVFERLEDHNLKRLLDRGVKVSIHSDDPAYFGGYIGENYLRAAEALGLSAADVIGLVRNSIEATFLPQEERAGLLSELDQVAEVGG